MSISSNIPVLLSVAAIVVVSMLVIGFTGLRLAKTQSSDIRIVWYLFSLSFILSYMLAIWASGIGAIDIHGSFQGKMGSAVDMLLKFMLDLEGDVKIFGSILGIVVLPQIASYLLSGLFGCASAPIFVGRSVSFFVWGLVKSFVSAAGVVLAIAIYGSVQNWKGWTAEGAASLASMSFLLLTVSLCLLYVYRDANSASDNPQTKGIPGLRNRVSYVKTWMTRNI